MHQGVEIRKLTVTGSEGAPVLQDYLAMQLGVSRRKAKEIIDSRTVFVNRCRVWMARHKLQKDDVVEIQQKSRTERRSGPIRILYRDSFILIVEKPAGELTNGPDSFEERMRRQLGMPELAAVHRLDRDTSGCLLVAVNRAAFDTLVALFESRGIHKEYHAVVVGTPEPPVRNITIPLEGRPATTRIRTLATDNNASHLILSIETGRTHQIRKHLSAIGNPILGDSHYGTAKPASDSNIRISRQMLHASSIAFTHPVTGRNIKASSRLPVDFVACLKMLHLV